ncbi:MAG: hypothetical protein CME70_11760 [Halobacteriovorax sp.]|nr:hypothetical protein [Halobacteriovorax sp.]|tara:strand:+ start:7081 stop:7992 length:912 start_codon:yes stop_codon:yes gene_type:complete
MNEISIESLFAPMNRPQFFESYISNKPIVVHGLEDKFKELTDLPFLKMSSLIEKWPETVNVYNEGTPDEVNSSKCSPVEAFDLFNKGRGLYFDDPNRFDKLIDEWLHVLRMDLGLSNLTYSRSLLYAIPSGGGTAAHFDQNINFVYQVSGTKKWWVAPNTSVQNPMTRHTLGHPIDPELASYAETLMPEDFPTEGAEEFTLEPGSFMFLPRGAWHKTQALSDSLSLNFTYSAPTWIDVLTTALRGRLAQSPLWRETADFVNEPDLHTHAIDKFDFLLKELSEDVPTWKAMDILGATEAENLED